MSEIKVALQGGFPRAYVLRMGRKTLAEAPPTTAGEQLLERKQKDVEMFWRPPRDISLLKAMCEERHEKHAACQALGLPWHPTFEFNEAGDARAEGSIGVKASREARRRTLVQTLQWSGASVLQCLSLCDCAAQAASKTGETSGTTEAVQERMLHSSVQRCMLT